jgi:hypothetical protein
MFMNINTKHTLTVIKMFLFSDNNQALLTVIDPQALFNALTIIMSHSGFKFKNHFFLQLTGCARMGTKATSHSQTMCATNLTGRQTDDSPATYSIARKRHINTAAATANYVSS